MPEGVFARHLPPSAGLPRVLALEPQTAAELGDLAEVTLASADAQPAAVRYDAIAGRAAPDGLAKLAQQLRPGGRLILAHAGQAEALLGALLEAGLIHCLVEPAGETTLYRGERPPEGSPLERVQAAAGPADEAGPASRGALALTGADGLKTPYVFLLVAQSPNKPAWKLAPDEPVTWRAVTLLPPSGGGTVLLAFSSLLKAVAFMQKAVLAGAMAGVNKIGKFPAQAARGWPLPLALNPSFEAVSGLEPGPAIELDPRAAVTGEE